MADEQSPGDEEIAAALAAVYMFCERESSEKDELSRKLSNWAQIARMESIYPQQGRLAGGLKHGGSFFTWRNVFARRWTGLFLILFLSSLQAPAFALERIQFSAQSLPEGVQLLSDEADSDSEQSYDLEGSKAPLCPMAPPLLLDAKSAPGLQKIRVCLNSDCQSVDLTLPDGGQIVSESGDLLAELPAHSSYELSLKMQAGNKRLYVNGKISGSNPKVLLSSTAALLEGNLTNASVNTVKGLGDFRSPPQITFSARPQFSLALGEESGKNEVKEFRAVSFTGSPAVLSPKSKALPPPVMSGLLFKTRGADEIICAAGKTYRGCILIKPRSGPNLSFLVINELDIEDYLLSVVPSEMPSGWPLEALKAQSIACRSYALANLGKHRNEAYDLKSSTEDQVYLGVQTESEQSNRAVAATRGLVLKHNGKVVSAFFHSSSGGATELAEHVWGRQVPYLRSVPDFDDQSPHFSWTRSIPVANIEDNLRKQGREIGGLLGIFALERSQSQRVSTALISGTLATVIVSGEELRKILGLPSTIFNLGGDLAAYLVAGRGFGHGLGMSQWGARSLSDEGYNAAQILSYYYKDVSVEPYEAR